MFGDKELEATRKYSTRKIKEILQSEKGADADYLRDLQTLIKLKAAAENQIEDYKN